MALPHLEGAPMRHRFLTIASVAGLLAVFGCGSDNKGTQGGGPCGTATCRATEVCTTSSSSPVCVCAPGYRGSTCSSCAPGYQMVAAGVCQLIPVDCSMSNA